MTDDPIDTVAISNIATSVYPERNEVTLRLDHWVRRPDGQMVQQEGLWHRLTPGYAQDLIADLQTALKQLEAPTGSASHEGSLH